MAPALVAMDDSVFHTIYMQLETRLGVDRRAEVGRPSAPGREASTQPAQRQPLELPQETVEDVVGTQTSASSMDATGGPGSSAVVDGDAPGRPVLKKPSAGPRHGKVKCAVHDMGPVDQPTNNTPTGTQEGVRKRPAKPTETDVPNEESNPAGPATTSVPAPQTPPDIRPVKKKPATRHERHTIDHANCKGARYHTNSSMQRGQVIAFITKTWVKEDGTPAEKTVLHITEKQGLAIGAAPYHVATTILMDAVRILMDAEFVLHVTRLLSLHSFSFSRSASGAPPPRPCAPARPVLLTVPRCARNWTRTA